jgi:hypothetical protein
MINLNTREGYLEALSLARANATDTVEDGKQPHKPDSELAAAHVILDALEALRERMNNPDFAPWESYSPTEDHS